MVQHVGPDKSVDGVSYLGFKSYDQGRRKFQGTGKHVIWLDEEPPADVYEECLLPLMMRLVLRQVNAC
jgi:terminase large subunit-like protein